MNAHIVAPDLTEEAVARLKDAPNPRAREVSERLIRHLHAFVREIRPSAQEWSLAIDFLTRTGHASTDMRQEFVLLSDVLGVSMLGVPGTPELPDLTGLDVAAEAP